jgi:hypothetical protein
MQLKKWDGDGPHLTYRGSIAVFPMNTNFRVPTEPQ